MEDVNYFCHWYKQNNIFKLFFYTPNIKWIDYEKAYLQLPSWQPS